MNRTDAVAQLKRVFTVLSNDLDEIAAYGRANPSPFAQRTLVRTAFALMEGLAYQLRQITLASLAQTNLLSVVEIDLLKEERHTLNAKGEPETRDNFQAFPRTLLFTIQCYLKVHGATYEPNTSHHGWEAMRKFVGIRNRITHPKSDVDLELSDADMACAVTADAWWRVTILEMLAACNEADDYWTLKLMQSSR